MKKKFTILLILILTVILLLIISFWYYKERVFSKSILRLEILGPETVQVAEEFEYTVRYKNNSSFTLEEPRLIFEYPEYSIGEEGKQRVTRLLKDIYPGDEEVVKFKARLLGKENDLKIAKTYLSYKPKNLKARYESDTTFTIKIAKVPLTLAFDLPLKLEKGRDVQFSLNYFSNLDYLLSNLELQVQYPENFKFIKAEPNPIETNEWDISELKKAQGGRVKITGNLFEEVGKKSLFSAKIGIWQEGEFVVLKETSAEVEVIEPLLYISQQINKSSNYVAKPGEKLHYTIYFKNIGTSPFENLFLINRLDSPIFDLSTIKVDLGQAMIDNNLIVWDWRQIPELRFLDVQEEGRVDFEITLKCCWSPTETTSNETFVKNKVTISQISQEFQTKVNSRLEISQKGIYEDANFGNFGPHPPIPGQTTTYTIVWQVKNYYNNVKNVKVKASLPLGVSLTGKIFPESETSRLSFDSVSREIIWTIPSEVPAGAGVLTPGPSVSFQVSVSPDFSQSGKPITLVNKAIITGEDQWTEKTIQGESGPIDTTLSAPDEKVDNLPEDFSE